MGYLADAAAWQTRRGVRGRPAAGDDPSYRGIHELVRRGPMRRPLGRLDGAGAMPAGEKLPPVTEEGCCQRIVPPRVSDADLTRWASVFRALADPTRLGILALLAVQQGPLCVCDIVERFPRGQPTISHHLKVLRDAGLVRAQRDGVWVYYSASPHALMEAWRAIGRLAP